ncbi:hypothetical protein OPT61_g2235 [Boeremia exigua]|uniref:Uncharacterized protein n=1 Tax=Boeremia exigua TaxID=749465 RepID=A0ACC2IM95_9PLEO|nr:hypothetical protein OPT61_g2235 [Boeremia exigua]
MADPLSVAGSITGLISIGDAVFRRLFHYVKSVKNAEKEVVGIKEEVSALTGVLHSLAIVALDLGADDRFDNTVRFEHVNSCLATLYRIQNTIPVFDITKSHSLRNTLNRLKWPLKSSETKEMGEEVRRHRDTLSLALSADTIVGLLQCLSSQNDVLNHIKHIDATMRRKNDSDFRITMNENRRRIFNSFFVVNPHQYYEKALDLRHPTTGFWLTQSDNYKSWIKSPGSRLWLTGIPGAGKTVLSGLVIQDCLERASTNYLVIYYYCDYRSQVSQDMVNLLSSLAGQIAKKHEGCFALLETYYGRLHRPDQMERTAKAEELVDLIQTMSANFDEVRIIVDGLDECGENSAEAAEVLHELILVPHNNISLAILSRDVLEIRDVIGATFDHIDVAAHTEDIEHYVRSEIEGSRSRLRHRSKNHKEEIVQRLKSKAHGMFRWVACQVDFLNDLITDAERRKALDQLPKTLNETYERILLNIKDHHIQLVSQTLMWLAHGQAALGTEALLEALSLSETNEYDPDARPTVEDVLYCCSSLIRRSDDRLELAHFTVQEYLQNLPRDESRLGQFSMKNDCQRSIAENCLRYLCLPIFDKPLAFDSEQIVEFRRQFPFHTYASTTWFNHARGYLDESEIQRLYRVLFAPDKTCCFIIFMCQVLSLNHGIGYSIGGTENNDAIVDLVSDNSFRPLHGATLLNLPKICQWLLDLGCDVDHKSKLGRPLEMCYQAIVGVSRLDATDAAALGMFLIAAGASLAHLPNGALGRISEVYHHSSTRVDSGKEDPPIPQLPIRRKTLQFSVNTDITSDITTDESYLDSLHQLIRLDQVKHVTRLTEDARFSVEMDIHGRPLLEIAAQAGADRTLQMLLKLTVVLEATTLRRLLKSSIIHERQLTTLLLVQFKYTHQIDLDMTDIVHNCVARGFREVLLLFGEQEGVMRSLDDDKRSAWFYVTDLTPQHSFELLSYHAPPTSNQDINGQTALHAVLDRSRDDNIWRGPVNNNFELDVMTWTMTDYLVNPASARIIDQEGNSVWFYFCARYVPRLITMDNTMAYSTLDTLTNRLLESKAVEVYDHEVGTPNGLDLLVSNVLQATKDEYVNEVLLAKMFNTVLTSKHGTTKLSVENAVDLLVWSVLETEIELFETLLGLNIDVYCPSKRFGNRSAIEYASEGHGYYRMFTQLILTQLENLEQHGSLLLDAVCTSKSSQVEKARRLQALLVAGADANSIVSKEDGDVPILRIAVDSDFFEGVAILLDHGADTGFDDPSRTWDLLAFVVEGGHDKLLRHLCSTIHPDKVWSGTYTWKKIEPWIRDCTIFHLAASNNDPETLEYLHQDERFPGLHSVAEDGSTPLHIAAVVDAEKSIEWLIQHGADINATTLDTDYTALHYAVREGNVTSAASLIKAGARFLPDSHGRIPDDLFPEEQTNRDEVHKMLEELRKSLPSLDLPQTSTHSRNDVEEFFQAIRRRNVQKCRDMIESKPGLLSSRSPKCEKCTPLIFALVKGYSDIVDLFLDHRASITGNLCEAHGRSFQELRGFSPIEIAVADSRFNFLLPKILEISIYEDADWAFDGITPVHVAAVFNPEALDILHQFFSAHSGLKHYDFHRSSTHTFSPDHHACQWCPSGRTPLDLALREGEMKSVDALVRLGGSISARNNHGHTPLHEAIEGARILALRYLLDHHVDINGRTSNAWTGLMICAKDGWIGSARMLLEHKPDLDAANERGETALHIAAKNGDLEMFAELARAGCDLHLKNIHGQSPAILALKSPPLATYIYMRGVYLDPTDILDHLASDMLPKGLRTLLLYATRTQGVERLDDVLHPRIPVLITAANRGEAGSVEALLGAGLSLESSHHDSWGSPLIAACAADEIEVAKILYRHGAKLASSRHGTPITAFQAAVSAKFLRWILVDQYFEKTRISDEATDRSPEIRCWSGGRKVLIPLSGNYNRRENLKVSLISWTKWIYNTCRNRGWQTFVPRGWQTSAHLAPLPGEADVSLSVYLKLVDSRKISEVVSERDIGVESSEETTAAVQS